ncbi:hypothetical protein [Brevundimonas sp. FT23028]|uniref:hypothetical protein n=1 Tax=Brevundimonas sp. FT23028 TaxID=3393748 RepID=UPI003B58AA10
MFDTLASQIGFAIAVLVTAFAFLKGDEPERVGAGAYMLGLFASQLVQDKGFSGSPQWPLMAIDAVFLAVCIGLAWKSRRAWPIWVCALQSLIVASHLLTLVDLRPPPGAFFAVINLASYGVLVAIAVGTFWAWQERRAAGLE